MVLASFKERAHARECKFHASRAILPNYPAMHCTFLARTQTGYPSRIMSGHFHSGLITELRLSGGFQLPNNGPPLVPGTFHADLLPRRGTPNFHSYSQSNLPRAGNGASPRLAGVILVVVTGTTRVITITNVKTMLVGGMLLIAHSIV